MSLWQRVRTDKGGQGMGHERTDAGQKQKNLHIDMQGKMENGSSKGFATQADNVRQRNAQKQMEGRERQMRESMKQSVRMVLMIYTIYSCFFVICSLQWYAKPWINMALLIAIISSWIVYMGKIGSLFVKSTYIVLMMQVTLCVYSTEVKDVYYVIPFFVAMVATVGLIGNTDLLRWFTLSNVIIFFSQFFILNRLDIHEDAWRALLHFANIELIVHVIIFWVKKRNENMNRIKYTIMELQEVENTKDDFLANVSHEIRTPINTICGISDILLQQEQEKELREQIFCIQTAGKNLSSVVGDILDFSELQSGRTQLAEEQYNITSTLNDVINMTLAKMNEKNIELIVDCDATIPCGLVGDEKKIRRVLMNLLDNSLKFTEDGCISIYVNYRQEEYGINLSITVKDSGIGIEPEKQELLFHSFSQGDARRNRRAGGMGLGLTISQILTEKMGGFISMKSVVGEGTVMRVVIPQKVVDPTPIIRLEEPEQYNIGVYLNMEQFVMPQVRDEYEKCIEHMVRQTKVKSHIFANLSEVKRRFQTEKFSHLFISSMEYNEDSAYFADLAKETDVVVVVSHQENLEEISDCCIRLYKPFYIVPVITTLKGSDIKEQAENQINGRLVSTENTHILVVDDNRMNLKVVEGFLQKYNIQVSTAISGRVALQLVEENRYDLIFMDHMMPEMDGIETMHRIRAKVGNYYRSVPIVALTANAIAGAREMFLEEGFTDFLEKPLERSVLERVLCRNLPEEKVICYEEEVTSQDMEEKEGGGKAISVYASVKATSQNVGFGVPREDMREQEEREGKKEIQKGNETKQNIQDQEKEKKQEETKQISVDVQTEQNMEDNTLEVDNMVIGDLDIQSGTLYCGSEENLIEILRICGDTAEENMDEIQKFYEERNWKEYTILVHGVKSSMKSVGANQLSEMAKNLEQAGKDTDEAYIDANHQPFMDEYVRVNTFLHASPLVYEQEEGSAPIEESASFEEISDQEFENRISQLESKMYDFDGAAMAEVVKDLQKCSYGSVPLDKPLTTILRKIEMSDFMSAYDTLVKVKSELKKKLEKQS